MTSIRRRLTAILTVQLVLAVVLGGVLIWFWARRSILSQFDTTLAARAELIQASVEEDDENLEIEFNLSKLAEFQRDAAPVHFQIRSRTGQPLITSEHFASLELPEGIWSDAQAPMYRSFQTGDAGRFRSLQTSFDAGDDLKGEFRGLQLLILRDRSKLDASLLQLAAVVAAAAGCSLVCLVPLVRRSLRKGLQPLDEFAARTGKIDLRQLPATISSAEAPAELQPIVLKLNELLDRVHASLLRERRFTRDVAHELRTPVAELRSIAELAALWEDQATPKAFTDVRDIAAEMEALVAGLTLLNRLDAGSVLVETAPHALAPFLRQILERLQGRIAAAGHTVIPPANVDSIVWDTDAALWKMAASNLLENAIAHSPPGSRIEITLTNSEFSVTNPAPGLAPGDVPQMTHPFWRKDAARSDQNHSGLGLALVDSIARTLGLQFRLELDAHGLLTVSLVAPPSSAAQESPR